MDFWIKLIDDKNKETEFADGGKKFPIVNFLIEFLAWIELLEEKKKQGRTYWRRANRAQKKLINFSDHNTKKEKDNTGTC